MPETLLPKAIKGLVALTLANLVWTAAIWWCLRFDDVRWALAIVAILFVAIGTLVAQTFVLGAWISFSDGRWFGRWAVPALILLALSTACGLGVGGGRLETAGAALSLAVLLCLFVALLIPLRRVRGWRLAPRQDGSSGELGRFRISDLLIWMVVIALPLAIVRFFTTLISSHDITIGMRAIAVSVLLLFPLLWLAQLVAFAPRGRQTVFLIWAIASYASVGTLLTTWFIFPWIEPLLWPLPGWFVVSIAGGFFVSGLLIVVLNGLALRALGYRLIRPAWRGQCP